MSAINLSFILLVLLHVTLPIPTTAQNPHERNMERAHPTPDPEYRTDFKKPKLPFVQQTNTFSSVFLNVNLIEEETDVLPAQNESSIAVNPTNPLNLIGSAVDYRNGSTTKAYYSLDGGKTWKNVDLGQARTGWRSSNDPSVCFDHNGVGYLCYGGFNREGNAQFGENAVFLSKTTDGGQTWEEKHIAVIIHQGPQTADSAFEDKYYVHADTAATSPYRGRLYIPWKRVINADSSTQIVIARSLDGGTTWLPPVAVSDRFPGTSEDTTFGQSFPLARTGPDGSVHLVWNSGTESSVRYARSTDGGSTWTDPQIIHTYQPFGNKSEVADQVNSRVKGVVRAEAYPTLAIDNTRGANNGNLYLCWSADRTPNIYFSRSTDNGTTWTSPKIVHSDTSNDQFWPWIAVDPTSGNIAVMYFDSRDDQANILVNCYVSLSTDAGQTWSDKRVGDAENDLRRNPFSGNTFAGDYSGCDFYNGIIYPSWVDMRNTTDDNFGDNDVYSAIVNINAPEAPSTMSATTIATEPTAIDVEWSEVATTTFDVPLSGGARYVLYRDGDFVSEFTLDVTAYRDMGLTKFQEYDYTLVVAQGADTSAPRNASAFAGGSRLPAPPTLDVVNGNNLGQLVVRSTMPTKRLDSVTSLVNLNQINVHYGNPEIGENRTSFQVAVTDTGRTLLTTVPAQQHGWYWVSVAAVDVDGNESPRSDTLWVYTGSTTWDVDSITPPVLYWPHSGTWAPTTAFAYSQPASYTDSPDGEYPRGARDTVMLHPRVLTLPTMRMSWRVAAFIHESDTVTLERSTSIDGEWQRVAWWNASKDPRWDGQGPGDDAWRWGSALVTGNVGDTMYTRLVLRSNVVNQGDGFYIDDITWDGLVSVEENNQPTIRFAPQPASSFVTAHLPNAGDAYSVTVTSVAGEHVLATTQRVGSTLIINVQGLAAGVYVVTLESAGSRFSQLLSVVR